MASQSPGKRPLARPGASGGLRPQRLVQGLTATAYNRQQLSFKQPFNGPSVYKTWPGVFASFQLRHKNP